MSNPDFTIKWSNDEAVFVTGRGFGKGQLRWIVKPWTPERVRVLRALWDQSLPASCIAELLRTSKNSVIGKARRLGLAPRRVRYKAA